MQNTVSSFHPVASTVFPAYTNLMFRKPITLYQLTPCSSSFPGKLILGHLVQKETALMVAACSARLALCSQ